MTQTIDPAVLRMTTIDCYVVYLIYQASLNGEQECPSFKFVWLLTQNRIHCKTALAWKNIIQNDRCDLCVGDDGETAEHIISECPFACAFSWVPGSASSFVVLLLLLGTMEALA